MKLLHCQNERRQQKRWETDAQGNEGGSKYNEKVISKQKWRETKGSRPNYEEIPNIWKL